MHGHPDPNYEAHGFKVEGQAYRFLRSILDGLQEPMLVIDSEKHITMLNTAARELLAPDAQQSPPLQCHHLFNHEERPCAGQHFACPVDQVRASGQPIKAEYECLLKGKRRVYEVLASPLWGPDGSFQGVIESLRDITERKGLEETLRRSEASYRTLARNLPGIVYRFPLQEDRGADFYNPDAVEQLTGYTVEEMPAGRFCAVSALILPEDQGRVEQTLREKIRDQQPFELEFVLRRRDGQNRCCLERGRPVYDPDGRPLFLEGIILDISERKEAEEALRRSERWLATTLNSIGDAVITTDAVGRITFLNPVAEKLTGWRRESALSRPLSHVFTIRDVATGSPVELPLEQVRRQQTVVEMPNYLLTGAQGEEFLIADSIAPIRDEKQTILGTVLVFRDVTAHKKMEEELQKSHKIESLGLLAGGIAHDFNNILTAILGNIELAKMFLPPEDQAFLRVSTAEEAAVRARGITQQLLTFAKGGAPIKKIASVPQLLQESVDFALRGSNVKSEYSFPADLWLIEVDEDQIRQVLNNLTLNASQAMPEGGFLRITAQNQTIAPSNPLDLPKGKYVRIALSDEGVGIPGKYLEKIFDPYFTTKKSGSGLGLAISYSIIKRHGGTITVDSRPGDGSTFSLVVPASEEQAVGLEVSERVENIAGSGRILVMDDEESVNEIATDMLRYLGYQPVTVTDGSQAVTAYEEALGKGAPFVAVITDLTVPGGLGGKEIIQRLLEIDSEAKVIVSSGYANDPVMSAHAEYGFAGVIPKPYRLAELGKTLREVTGSRKG